MVSDLAVQLSVFMRDVDLNDPMNFCIFVDSILEAAENDLDVDAIRERFRENQIPITEENRSKFLLETAKPRHHAFAKKRLENPQVQELMRATSEQCLNYDEPNGA